MTRNASRPYRNDFLLGDNMPQTIATKSSLELVVGSNGLNRAVLLIARMLVASLFLVAAAQKFLAWDGTVSYFGKLGLIAPGVILALVLALEICAGILLIVGWRTSLVATIVAAFTLAAGLIAHQFWSADPAQFGSQLNNFLKNVAIAGGLLYMAACERTPRSNRPVRQQSPDG